jgi:NADH:ubiquinone oxidoreductase subunit 5 (subunit L)/multisubunit Na+/H+ antiporter MnhA subunit
LFLSPIGPALILLAGAAVELGLGRWFRRAQWLTWLALAFLGFAALLYTGLQFTGVVPTFGRPWQPLLQGAANLYWIADGWNYYLGALILLLGGLGILLNLPHTADGKPLPRLHSVLATDLTVIAASLLFVNSGNLLTVLLTWVFLDITVILRLAAEPVGAATTKRARSSEAQVFSLVGAVFLYVALLPAGPNGLAQELTSGALPVEALLLLLLAATIRSGLYPFHLWLLPRATRRLNLSERLLDHLVPVLAGLWLWGRALQLGGSELLFTPETLFVITLAIFAAALAAFTAQDHIHYVAFALIASAGTAVLAGLLGEHSGPSALVWPLTAFALGGALWLVGDQVWRAWGWQIPVSVGALALAGVPFTPGFMAQPALARMATSGPAFWPAFLLYVLAQGMLIASVLRSWNAAHKTFTDLPDSYLIKLLTACLLLGLPLAVAGFLPRFAETLVGIPNTIASALGNPPNVVAGAEVWITLALPLLLGFGLVWLYPRVRPRLGALPNRISRVSQLEWLFNLIVWGIDRGAQIGNHALHVIEGAGYVGWALAMILLGWLLVR